MSTISHISWVTRVVASYSDNVSTMGSVKEKDIVRANHASGHSEESIPTSSLYRWPYYIRQGGDQEKETATAIPAPAVP